MTWLPLLTKIQTVSADVTLSPVILRKEIPQHWDNASNSSWTHPRSEPLAKRFLLWVIVLTISLHSNRKVTKTSLVILGKDKKSVHPQVSPEAASFLLVPSRSPPYPAF